VSDQETPIAESAKTECEPKPVRKSKQKKAKKDKKRDSHACRPRPTISYWIDGIENGRFKGAELVLAIERVEAHEKDKKRKKLEKSKPNTGNILRTVLSLRPNANAPKVQSQPVAKIAEYAQDPKPQSEVIVPPEVTDSLEPPLPSDV
jgi:hypothetical protein